MIRFFAVIFLLVTTSSLFAQSVNLVWAKQMGGTADDFASSINVDGNGNVYTTGRFNGSVDFDPGIGTFFLTAAGRNDAYISKTDPSGNFLWARRIGQANDAYYIESKSINIDANGNVYTSGFFKGTIDFNPGDDFFYMTSTPTTSNIESEFFVCKLDADGKFLWAKQLAEIDRLAGTSGEDGISVTVDAKGNFYTTGSFYKDTQDFDPGPGTFNMTAVNHDVFITKLDPSGSFVWAKKLSGKFKDFGYSIAVDRVGNVYTTGEFSTTADFDPSLGVFEMTTTGFNTFVSKLDTDGNFMWAKQFSSSGHNYGYSIKIDGFGNSYIVGFFNGTADFNPGLGIYQLTTSVPHNFIAKLDVSGDFIWARDLGVLFAYYKYFISLDASGSVYCTGSFNGTVDFDPGPTTYYLSSSNGSSFISKLDPTGNFLFANNIKSYSTSIFVVDYKNIYLTGTFLGTADFDPGPGIFNLTSAGGSDIFVMKLKQEQSLFTTPGITLSKGSVPAGQTMTIKGNSFTSNKAVILNFNGAGGMYSNDVTANDQGAFSYIYNIPSNAQNGIASVKAYDAASQTYSVQQSFQIQLTPANTPVSALTIVSPIKSKTYSTGQQIHFLWSDKLIRQYGDYYYPLAANSGKRLYRYRVEYQIGTSGTWKLVNTFNGSGAVNAEVNLNQIIKINTIENSCRIRVTDDYAPANVKTTVAFSVVPVTSNLKAELIWDKSFKEPDRSPEGVAADGVARLYLKVSKLDPNIGSNINSVSVSIIDGSRNTSSWLGKLKKATILDGYSTEANDATTISSTSNTFVKGGYWFWYVAPEDFTESDDDPYANLPERFVTLHVTAQLKNGVTDIEDVTVKIVRPPLMIVHGLASSEAGWKKFHYSLNNVDYTFTSSPLFRQVKAVNLNPRKEFLHNAYLLLTPETPAYNGGSNKPNTFQGNIEEIRKKGYAANQVDYVCHSMGGCVLRSAIDKFKDKYYGQEKYQNYSKGYVHKAITINTPHNSSPVADAVTEFIPKAPRSINVALGLDYDQFPNTPFVFDFIEPDVTKDRFNFPWKATQAIVNLQVSDIAGGINFPTTPVKNHLIAGDIKLYNKETASFLAEMDKYMDLIDRCLKIMRDISPTPVLNNILKYGSKTVRALAFIEYYSAQKGFSNFLGAGDLIVPLNSQLAGLAQNIDHHISIFNNSNWLNANHLQIVDRTDVGDMVKKLLNSRVESDSFANIIPSTPPTPLNRVSKPTDTFKKALVSSYDTVKVKITAPMANSLLFADSTINITFKLNDTVGLAYIDVDFQGVTTTSTSLNPTQIVNTQVDPSYIGSQLIYVTAVYDRDTVTEFHTDTLTTNVQTNAQLLDFQVEPESKEMQINEEFYPNYKGIYNTSVAELPNNTSGITVSVANKALIKYDPDTRAFTALADTGTTIITFSYKEFSDTVFISLGSSDNYKVLCPQNSISFFAGVNDATKTYKWQVDTSTGFVDLTDSMFYSNTNTPTLNLNSPPTSIYGYRYRCIFYDSISSEITPPQTIKFQTTWTGGVTSAWENPANWSCGSLPDSNTDVIISSIATHFPNVGSNVSCRSVTLQPGATTIVKTGYRLNITGKADE